MYRNLCLVCGKATLGEEFCSPQHETKYMTEISPANAIPELEEFEKARRALLLDTVFNGFGPERAYAATELLKYGLTAVGRKDKIYDLAKVAHGEA